MAEMAKKFSHTTIYFSVVKLLITFVAVNLLQLVEGKFGSFIILFGADLNFQNAHERRKSDIKIYS